MHRPNVQVRACSRCGRVGSKTRRRAIRSSPRCAAGYLLLSLTRSRTGYLVRATMSAAVRHHRRSIRLRGYDYTRVGAYFITILTHEREHSLCSITASRGDGASGGDACIALTGMGEIAQRCWYEIPAHFPHVEIDTFQIMPDHLHGIIIIASPPPLPRPDEERRVGVHPDGRLMPTGRVSGSVGAIVSSYKSAVSRLTNLQRGTPGAKLWHRDYYEVIIRDPAQHMRISDYIERNPPEWLRHWPGA